MNKTDNLSYELNLKRLGKESTDPLDNSSLYTAKQLIECNTNNQCQNR
jgi:hypothetical protein